MKGRAAAFGAAGLAGAAAAGWAVRRVWHLLLAGAEPPGREVSVDEDLTLMFQTLDGLRELAAVDGGSRSADAIYGFSVRWGTMLAGRLVRLTNYRDDDRLSPEQRERYDRLTDGLHDALPLIDELGLVRPSVTLGETRSAKTDFRRHHEQ